MNKNEFKAEAARIGKLLGVNPTMDNYTFSDPKSPVFQIKEKELRSVVRKAKALKDKEAHGIEDIEWDFEEGYIVFILPGDLSLYMSTEADMEMNESKTSIKNEVSRLAKVFGVKPKLISMDKNEAYYQITASEYKKIIDEFEDQDEDPEAFNLMGLYPSSKSKSIEFTTEDEDSITFGISAVNESTNEKQFFKEFTQTTGIRVGRDSEIYEDNRGLVAIDAYDKACLQFGIIKPGKWGKFDIKSIKFDGYYTFDVLVEYEGEVFNLQFHSNGSARTSADNAKPLAEMLLKNLGLKSSASGKIRGYYVSDVDPKAYSKLKQLKPGTVEGDLIITAVGANPNGVYGGSPFIVEAVHPKGFVELVFRDAEVLKTELNESANLPEHSPEVMNESTELNEVTGLPKHKTIVPKHML